MTSVSTGPTSFCLYQVHDDKRGFGVGGGRGEMFKKGGERAKRDNGMQDLGT